MKAYTPYLKMMAATIIIVAFGTMSVVAQTNMSDSSALPKVFAPNIISTSGNEWSTTFTPDGKTVYFCRGASYWTICFSKKVRGKWQRPQVAPFSGKYSDTDPCISPDGNRLFFVSNRPETGNGEPGKYHHLWYVDHLPSGTWSTPKHIESPVNIDGSNNYAPSVSASGTLFFCSRGREGNKGMCGYTAKWLGNHYDKPERLILLGDQDVQDPFTAPDESFVIFLSGKDLYYCRKVDGKWDKAEKLGPQINNGDPNSSPSLSRNGRILYYSSSRTKGFYKRNINGPALNFDGIDAESKSIFNSDSNILFIPLNLWNNKTSEIDVKLP